MTSAIDTSKPVTGSPTTQSVRDNFLAARNEIVALQSSIGYADYQDTLTATTPISPTIGTLKLNQMRPAPFGLMVGISKC